jgi:hypothetical protein
MNRRVHVKRFHITIFFSMVLWVTPAAAQLQVGGLHLGLAGDLNAGYDGDISNTSGSDHGAAIGGDLNLHGYYYHPNFISFDAAPYYGRSQSNSSSGSISDSSGYTSNVAIFGGSHFPGSISFNQGFDSTGVFGIPGNTGLSTKENNKSFAAGWSLVFPGKPSLTFGFSSGSGTSSVLGSNEQSEGSSKSFSAHTGYSIAGFGLGAGYIHLNTNTTSTGFDDTTTTSNFLSSSSSSNNYLFSLSHRLPMSGSFAFGANRSDYTTSSGGGTNTGTSDNLNASFGINVKTFPISASVSYTDNLYGSIEEQLLSNGGSVLQTTISQTSRALLVNVSTSHMVFNRVFVTAFLNRQEEMIAGNSYGLTQYGANAAYNFARRLKGLTITLGVTDSASQVGNMGANLLSNVNYNRNFGRWEFSANYSYNQNVQTLLAIYTVSSMNYTAQVHRKMPHGFSLNLGGGGGRSGFEQTPGNAVNSESVNASISWGRFGLGGTYSETTGSQVLTASGLVSVPVPIATPNSMVNFNGSGYGFNASAIPIRNLSITATYNKSNSTTAGAALSSLNETDLINAFCTYRFRKISFNSGVTKFRQSISNTGSAPSVITSYYFGISRWFKFF